MVKQKPTILYKHTPQSSQSIYNHRPHRAKHGLYKMCRDARIHAYIEPSRLIAMTQRTIMLHIKRIATRHRNPFADILAHCARDDNTTCVHHHRAINHCIYSIYQAHTLSPFLRLCGMRSQTSTPEARRATLYIPCGTTAMPMREKRRRELSYLFP